MSRRSHASEQGGDEATVSAFIAKFEPKHQTTIRSVRRAMRSRFPGAYELVYDNYNFFVIGYSPTERPSDSVVSITANANGVALCFIQGARLPDPNHLLRGSGNQTRSIGLPSPAILKTDPVQALLDEAESQVRTPFLGGKIKLVIRSISAKQRPRRKVP